MTPVQPPAGDLSEILARLGVGDGAALVGALGLAHRLGPVENLKLLAAGERQRLGDLLQAAQRLTRQQLRETLMAQRDSGQRMGEILMQRGLLSAAEFEVVLAFQQAPGNRAGGASQLRLGNVLVATGHITPAQLAHGLGLQWQSNMSARLGDALVGAGHVSAQQVKDALQLQRKLVAAVMLCALALTASLAPRLAQAGSKSASLQASAVIHARAHLRTDFQAMQLSISQEDIGRGYVDAPGASRFTVVTPKGGNYFVEFQPRSDWFRTVNIEGLGSQVELGADGGSVAQSAAGLTGATRTLDYRFWLKADAQPGVHDWPLLLAVRAR